MPLLALRAPMRGGIGVCNRHAGYPLNGAVAESLRCLALIPFCRPALPTSRSWRTIDCLKIPPVRCIAMVVSATTLSAMAAATSSENGSKLKNASPQGGMRWWLVCGAGLGTTCLIAEILFRASPLGQFLRYFDLPWAAPLEWYIKHIGNGNTDQYMLHFLVLFFAYWPMLGAGIGYVAYKIRHGFSLRALLILVTFFAILLGLCKLMAD